MFHWCQRKCNSTWSIYQVWRVSPTNGKSWNTNVEEDKTGKLYFLTCVKIKFEIFFVIKVLEDLETYLKKAIPDTKLTIKKYADVKFEYLSYCLKVKEMDDEEVSYCTIGEPLYRVEAGNIEYRYVIFLVTRP